MRPFDKDEHMAHQAHLREHQADLRAHTARQKLGG
jgi:hypothetical protein